MLLDSVYFSSSSRYCQLAQDDDGFEIRSLADSLDEEDGGTAGDRTPVPSDTARDGLSPHPPPKPVTRVHSPLPRESLDGETIFAVGEDGDKWSDEDESPRNSGERKRLTGKDS